MGTWNRTIEVSDLVSDILYNMPLTDQTDSIKKLSEEEKYLLIWLTMMNYSEEDVMILSNLQPFIEYMRNISKSLKDENLSIPFDTNKYRWGSYSYVNKNQPLKILGPQEIIEHRRNILIDNLTKK